MERRVIAGVDTDCGCYGVGCSWCGIARDGWLG